MSERVNEQVPVETSDRGLFDFTKKDEEAKPIKEETLVTELDNKAKVSDPVEAEYQDALDKKFGATAVEAEYKDEEEKKKHGATPEETTDHSLFDLIKNDTENKIPVTEETFGTEDQDEKKHGTVVQMLRSYTSFDEEGHKDEAAEETHVPIEKPHVQEEEPEKKSFLDKIKDKLPGHSKTDDSHDEAVPVSVEPVVKGEEEDKKGFMDKIKDKIPGLSSSKTSDDKNDHVDK